MREAKEFPYLPLYHVTDSADPNEDTMKRLRPLDFKIALLVSLLLIISMLSTRLKADTGLCGGTTTTLPFTDVQGNPFFCAIAAAYFSGLTNGTSSTTYSPTERVPREQMAAFVTRTLDQSLKRGSRRAALGQWYTPTSLSPTALTIVGTNPVGVASDGADLWVANLGSGSVSRVQASDGRLLDGLPNATSAVAVLIANGRVYVVGSNGSLYIINPKVTPGAVGLLTSSLGPTPNGIAFDGHYVWTSNLTSISRVDPNTASVSSGNVGLTNPYGMLYDGQDLWVTDRTEDMLKRVNKSNGLVSINIAVGDEPQHPVFDGMNIWVPNRDSDSVTVVRVKDASGNPLTAPFVVGTLTGNGLDGPVAAAFDGERILVANFFGNSVSLWKAADLSPLGSISTGEGSLPAGVCSDGVNFWVTLIGTNRLARL
jgi:hypothetical protein